MTDALKKPVNQHIPEFARSDSSIPSKMRYHYDFWKSISNTYFKVYHLITPSNSDLVHELIGIICYLILL